MLRKKFYIPIGIFILVICAVGLLSLRSDTPKEPVVTYKAVTPVKHSATPLSETRTVSASIPIEETAAETAEETAVSTSEVSEVLMSEILSKYPDYETMDPWNQENVRRWVRKDKMLAELEARAKELERQLAEREALEALESDLESSVGILDSEYSDVRAFYKRYTDPELEDFIREFPDETERRAFMLRTLEMVKIQQAMADRILETPGAEELSSEILVDLMSLSSLNIDEMIGGAK
jgi:hypothetical protein